MIDYEKCEYFEAIEDTMCSTVFDHPDYDYFCNKDGKHKRIIFPEGCCGRCLAKQAEKLNMNLQYLKWTELNKIIEDTLHIREKAILKLYKAVKSGELKQFRDYGGWGENRVNLYKKEDAKDCKYIIDTVEAGYKENVYDLLHNLLGAKAWEYLQELIQNERNSYYLDTTMFYIDLACKLSPGTIIYKKLERFTGLGVPVIMHKDGLLRVDFNSDKVYTYARETDSSSWLEMTELDINKHRALALGLFKDGIINMESIKDEMDTVEASYNILIDNIAKEILARKLKK